MFIVLHKPTGKYFKKHNWRGRLKPFLADINKARHYRSRGGALMSVGTWIYHPRIEGQKHRKNFGHYELDESIWEIQEVILEIKPV